MKAHTALAVAAAGLLALSGCGAVGARGPAGATSSAGGPVTLSLWAGGTAAESAGYRALVEQFNATHPDIQVAMDLRPWTAIQQQLPAAWAAGRGPDLAMGGADQSALAGYLRTNSVLPLDSAVGTAAGRLNANSWPAAVRTALTASGHLYAVPASLAPVVLYYDKAMFAAAGITAPPATQDQFVADARKLTIGGANPTQYGLSLADHQGVANWPILQWMNGGDLAGPNGCSTVTSLPSVQALTTWADLVHLNHISPPGQTGTAADQLFATKRAAMELAGPAAAEGFRSAGVDFGIAPVPVGRAGPVTAVSVVPLVIARTTAHPAPAMEFLSWWTNQPAQATFSVKSGFPPTRTDVSVSNSDIGVFASALPTARVYLAGVPQAARIDTEIYAPMIAQITRGANIQQSANAAASAINELTGCPG